MIPMEADTGPIGGQSHEFLILAETGESGVYFHKDWLDTDLVTDIAIIRICSRWLIASALCAGG